MSSITIVPGISSPSASTSEPRDVIPAGVGMIWSAAGTMIIVPPNMVSVSR
jgi:hypothetical protein